VTGDGALIDALRKAHPDQNDEATYHAFGKPVEMAAIE